MTVGFPVSKLISALYRYNYCVKMFITKF